MSNVVYQSDKVLIRKSTSVPKQSGPGLEIFTQKEDVAGNKYLEWAGLIESSSNYYTAVLNLVERLQQCETIIQNLKFQVASQKE